MTNRIAAVFILVLAGGAPAQSLFDEAFSKAKPEKSEFALNAESGPYMVKIASFTGDDGQKFAVQLASELREKHKLQAFVHRYKAVNVLQEREKEEFVKRFEEKFKIKPRMPKFVTPPPDNWVVLAGDYRSIDDPKARAALDQVVRRINPQTFSPELIKRMMAEGVSRPPKAFTHAMLVRNPLLPPERAGVVVDQRTGKPKAVIDRKTAGLLLKLNDPEQFSVYKNPAPFTIKVAEFQGASTLNEQKAERIFGSLKRERNVDSHKSALQRGAENAIILCDSLRKEGYEAYVFHGEYASIVTVGGYRSPEDPRLKADVAAILESMKSVADSNSRVAPNKRAVVLAPSPINTPRRPTPDVIAN